MTDYFNKLIDIIKEKRPRLRDTSLSLYARNMRKLAKMLDYDFNDVDFLKDKSAIENILKDKSQHTIKTYYASIIVVLLATDAPESLIKKYRDDMDKLSDLYNKEKLTNTKSKKMTENWVEYKDLIKVMETLRKKVNYDKIFQKETLTKKENALLQQYVISSLYLMEPETNPPLRLGYAPMLVTNEKDYKKIDKPRNNYLVIKNRNTKHFVFHDYKTSGTYKDKEILVGKKLNSLLNKWLKFNTSGYLLLNSKGDFLTSNGLTKALNNVFSSTGKNISASMLRHAYLSERYAKTEADKKVIAEQMLHSTSEQTSYIKN